MWPQSWHSPGQCRHRLSAGAREGQRWQRSSVPSLLSSSSGPFVSQVRDDPASAEIQAPRSATGHRRLSAGSARLYTMEMTIEHLAPALASSRRCRRPCRPGGQYRDLTELVRLSHYLRRSWDYKTSRNTCCNYSSTCWTPHGGQPRMVAVVRLASELNQQVMEHHRLRNQIVEMKGPSLPAVGLKQS